MSDTPPEFDRFVGETDLELRMLGRFIHATEVGIEEVRQKESEQLERQRAEITGEFIAVVSAQIDHMVAHVEELPRMLRYGQVVSLYSFLEARLKSLCEEVKERDGSIDWKLEDLTGNMSLQTFRVFLTQVVDAGVSVWEPMNTVRLARNCIAHANGWIDRMERGKGQLRRRIDAESTLDEEDGRLVLSEDYVVKAYQDCHTLFSESFASLRFGTGLMPFEYPPETGVRITEASAAEEVTEGGEG